ncbi:MAG: sigma-70 family RNA polymerase sigma factor [Actinobacteria bacterium]|nr:sigma-70 family RNA polymerase sigma factor [Actinomycetota bacterium]
MAERWDVSDDESLRRVVEGVLDEVYRYASRLAGADRQLAEDLVQDAFVRLIRAARASRVVDVGPGWFFTTIRNRFIDHLRSTSRLDVGLPDEHAAAGGARGAVVTVDSDDSLAWLTDRLSPLERFVLVAHHVDGFGVSDVAGMIGKSVHATESLLVTARAHARRIVNTGGDRHG